MPFIGSIRYREAGEGRPGTPFLLLHGAGMSSVVWLPILRRLGRRAVAIDLPGHGRSPGAVHSLDEMLAAVGHAAAGLCLGPAILVGHSLGGALALAAAAAWPDKVRGLVLVTSAARFAVSQDTFTVLERSFTRWPARFAEVAFAPHTPADTRLRAANLVLSAEQEQTLADHRIAAAIAGAPAVTAPTLVVAGADDLITPPAAVAGLTAAIPGAIQVDLPAGHLPTHECPDLLVAAITSFVERIP